MQPSALKRPPDPSLSASDDVLERQSSVAWQTIACEALKRRSIEWTLRAALPTRTSADLPDPASTAEWFAANTQPSGPTWEQSPR